MIEQITTSICCPECGYEFTNLVGPVSVERFFDGRGMCFQCYKAKVGICEFCNSKGEVFYYENWKALCSACITEFEADVKEVFDRL